MNIVLGFNGERADPISGHYHLGNGYRAYSPVLMRFTCPDSWSPFGAGGINPYAYCEGDPINRADPSGHMSGSAIAGIVTGAIGIVLGIVSLLSAPVTGGSSIAAWMSTMATVTGLVSDAVGIAGAALEERNPAAATKLGWASLALGVAAMGAGLAAGRMARTPAKELTVAPKIKTENLAVVAESLNGYDPAQVAAWDQVAIRGLRRGRLPGGAPDNMPTQSAEKGFFTNVKDNVLQSLSKNHMHDAGTPAAIPARNIIEKGVNQLDGPLQSFPDKLFRINRNLASHGNKGLSVEHAKAYTKLACDAQSGEISNTGAHAFAAAKWAQKGGAEGVVGTTFNAAGALASGPLDHFNYKTGNIFKMF